MLEIEPDEFGRTAANIEDQCVVALLVDERCAPRNRKASLGLAPDDFKRKPRFALNAGDEVRPVFCNAAGFRRNVREIASSERRPEWLTPSPSLMIREKASMTKKPRREGRATSRRQLLVPRSRAP